MDNIVSRVERNKLFLEIDLSPDAISRAVPSSTGKTFIVASTRGAKEVPGIKPFCQFSLNVTVRK